MLWSRSWPVHMAHGTNLIAESMAAAGNCAKSSWGWSTCQRCLKLSDIDFHFVVGTRKVEENSHFGYAFHLVPFQHFFFFFFFVYAFWFGWVWVRFGLASLVLVQLGSPGTPCCLMPRCSIFKASYQQLLLNWNFCAAVKNVACIVIYVCSAVLAFQRLRRALEMLLPQPGAAPLLHYAVLWQLSFVQTCICWQLFMEIHSAFKIEMSQRCPCPQQPSIGRANSFKSGTSAWNE